MGIDAISGNLTDEFNTLDEMLVKIQKNEFSASDLKFLENLENAFRFAESAYDKNTLNYEVTRELHDNVMSLLVQAKENKCNLKDFKEVANLLSQIAEIKEEARAKGLKSATLERTDRRLGRAIVYRIK
jgi:hypothetical protein